MYTYVYAYTRVYGDVRSATYEFPLHIYTYAACAALKWMQCVVFLHKEDLDVPSVPPAEVFALLTKLATPHSRAVAVCWRLLTRTLGGPVW